MDMYLIIFVALAFMGLAIFRFWKIRHQQVNAIASVVTVVGVLGTFVGIAWGLLNFDTKDIEASVPKLLEGLKAAFITSILGIGGSIALKWLTLNEQKKRSTSTETDTGATVDDLAGLLRDILEVEKEEGKETRESLQSIEKSLTGEGDSTVLTQLQKLRTTFSDKQDDLVRAFNEFAEKMAENNTNALIEALEEVMRDFNTKINEQFGDNFRQLNEAVGRINDWQEQYRQQMNELAEEFRIAAESVEQSRLSLEIIANRSDAIVSSAEQLNPILQALQEQLEAFRALAESAHGAFPMIESRLNRLTDDFSNTVTQTIKNSDIAIKNQRIALSEQSEQLNATVQKSTTLMTEQISHLEQALEAELKQSLNTLGSQLASLSKTFVDDYTPLANRLRAVVEIANRLPESSSQQSIL